MHFMKGHRRASCGSDYRSNTLPVMAIHCSGSNHSQWTHLAEHLDSNVRVITPDLAGPERVTAGWSMANYSLSEETEPLKERLRKETDPIHLIGHSYGGAVAMRIAIEHPELVASLCLYEPTLFGLLNRNTPEDITLYEEIQALATAINEAIDEGFSSFAAEVFTDFWGGVGAWQALRQDRQRFLIEWISKCPLDFGALLNEPTGAYGSIQHPTTLVFGGQTQKQTQRIVDLLALELPAARTIKVNGAGHLGPFTFRDRVTEIIDDHLRWAKEAQEAPTSR